MHLAMRGTSKSNPFKVTLRVESHPGESVCSSVDRMEYFSLQNENIVLVSECNVPFAGCPESLGRGSWCYMIMMIVIMLTELMINILMIMTVVI